MLGLVHWIIITRPPGLSSLFAGDGALKYCRSSVCRWRVRVMALNIINFPPHRAAPPNLHTYLSTRILSVRLTHSIMYESHNCVCSPANKNRTPADRRFMKLANRRLRERSRKALQFVRCQLCVSACVHQNSIVGSRWTTLKKCILKPTSHFDADNSDDR